MQDAFAVALERWPRDGWPTNPRAWLVSTARFKAIDRQRRAGRLAEISKRLQHEPDLLPTTGTDDAEPSDTMIPDDRLRLLFTCCHPTLGTEAQVALALRTLCGLQTDEIARAFLVAPATMAQRLVRAKRKIREAAIPYAIPPAHEMHARVDAVAATIYLVFNEGYAATGGEERVRGALCTEAIRLGRVLATLLPDEPEPTGLLALMILHDTRRSTRVAADGSVVPLDEQDRTRWDRARIDEGLALCARANAPHTPGPYALQAAIAAEHARATEAAATDWQRVVTHYEALLALRPSPVVELNHAAAVAMARGYGAGLALIDRLKRDGALTRYAPLWSTEAELLRRAGRREDAAAAYRRALALVPEGAEHHYLARRLAEVE